MTPEIVFMIVGVVIAVFLAIGVIWRLVAPKPRTTRLAGAVWAAFGPYDTAEDADSSLRHAIHVVFGPEGITKHEGWIHTHIVNFYDWEAQGSFQDAQDKMRSGLLLIGHGHAFKAACQEIKEEAVAQVREGMEFELIPVGKFMMGLRDSPDECPVHPVNISQPFYLGKYPVTQGQWQAVMGDNPRPSHFKNDPNLPVERVSWDDVQEFISKQKAKEGSKKYRLPTEAEWEYAARSGGKDQAWAGTSREEELGEYAWYDSNSEYKSHPVGKKKPNGLRLHDMSGNVFEWVQDCWHENYNGAPNDGTAWGEEGGGDCGLRVIRGGSWGSRPRSVRSSSRGGYNPGDRSSGIGFRLAQDID